MPFDAKLKGAKLPVVPRGRESKPVDPDVIDALNSAFDLPKGEAFTATLKSVNEAKDMIRELKRGAKQENMTLRLRNADGSVYDPKEFNAKSFMFAAQEKITRNGDDSDTDAADVE